jgi:hypothetical protein
MREGGQRKLTPNYPDPSDVLIKYLAIEGTASSAIAFRAAASAIGPTSPAATITINKPSGVAEDDQLIAAIGKPGSPNAAVTPPSGWTLVRSMPSNFLNIYRLSAGDSEPSTYTWTFSESVNSAGGIMAFQNVDPDDPIDAENGQNTASGTAHATPDVTTTIPDTMIVTAHGLLENSSFTAPSGMTEAYDVPNSGLATTAGYYVAQPDAGATGAKTATSANSATGSAHILCLKPTGGTRITILTPTTNRHLRMIQCRILQPVASGKQFVELYFGTAVDAAAADADTAGGVIDILHVPELSEDATKTWQRGAGPRGAKNAVLSARFLLLVNTTTRHKAIIEYTEER